MSDELDENIMVMRQTYGIDLSMYDKSFLINSLERRMVVTGTKNAIDYCCYLKNNSTEADALYSSLNITFSQFFREPLAFALLEQRILPSIISNKADGSEIRVWSAGCACGQEAYSIAMLLDELIGARKKELRFRVFATDISKNALSAAEIGVYDYKSIENLKFKYLQNYFSLSGETYSVIPRLKQSVNYSYYNLLAKDSSNPQESIYGDFDIVFCCNLLLYYKTDTRLFIINKLKKSITNTGFLVTGEAERSIVEKAERMQSFYSPVAIFQNR